LRTPLPNELEDLIIQRYMELNEKYQLIQEDESASEMNDYDLDVAVRSSATAEDLPDASFAGQQETYLNVHGSQQVIHCVLKCFASLFTDRAISYRTLKGFDHFEVALSCGIQKMVRSDLASAGVIFTIDTENGFNNVVLVTGSYGLGEMVVQGTVNPDEFIVFKPTLKNGFKSILEKRLGSKEAKMIYSVGGNMLTRNVDVSAIERAKFCLNDEEVLQLARWACIIEEHYSSVHRKYTPMDIEWAKCGKTGNLFIVQARPETVQSRKMQNVLRSYKLNEKGLLLTKGKSVGEMIGAGSASVIKNVHDISLFKAGDVLVTNRTDPDWEPIMKKAIAIVTNQGGRTCHAAIIARELGIPAVVGCSDATEKIATGDEVTVSCSEGDIGLVYDGILSFSIEETLL
jgi:pyruvate,water dikinase